MWSRHTPNYLELSALNQPPEACKTSFLFLCFSGDDLQHRRDVFQKRRVQSQQPLPRL